MAESEQIFYEVDQVLARRQASPDETEYLVRWQGYDSDQDSWEPAYRLGPNAHTVIARFNESSHTFPAFPPTATRRCSLRQQGTLNMAATPSSTGSGARTNHSPVSEQKTPKDKLANHTPPLLPSGGSRWSIRRFSHDSTISASSSTDSATGSKPRRKRSDTITNVPSTSTSTSPTGSLRSTNKLFTPPILINGPSDSKMSPKNPINIITDYEPISAPLTPSPSVKSPRGSPRGAQQQPTQAASSETNSPKQTKAAQSKRRRGSQSPLNVTQPAQSISGPRSPKAASLPSPKESQSQVSPFARVKKKLSLDVASPSPEGSATRKKAGGAPRGKPRVSSPKSVTPKLKNSESGKKTMGSPSPQSNSVVSKTPTGDVSPQKKVLVAKPKRAYNRKSSESLSIEPKSRKRSYSSTSDTVQRSNSESSIAASSSTGIKPKKAAPAKRQKKIGVVKTYPARVRQSRLSLDSQLSYQSSSRPLSPVATPETVEPPFITTNILSMGDGVAIPVLKPKTKPLFKRGLKTVKTKEGKVTKAKPVLKIRLKMGKKVLSKVGVTAAGIKKRGRKPGTIMGPHAKKLKLTDESELSSELGGVETATPVLTPKPRAKPRPKPKPKPQSEKKSPQSELVGAHVDKASTALILTPKPRVKPVSKPKPKLLSEKSVGADSVNELGTTVLIPKPRTKPGPKPKPKPQSEKSPKAQSIGIDLVSQPGTQVLIPKPRAKPGPKPKPKPESVNSPQTNTPKTKKALNTTPQSLTKSKTETMQIKKSPKPLKTNLKKPKATDSSPKGGPSIAKRKNSNFTVDIAKKFKMAAQKKRVTLLAPLKTPRKRTGMFIPRSPRKSPRIILKDVIQLSKIEYEMAMKAARKSPSPNAKKVLIMKSPEESTPTQKEVEEKTPKQISILKKSLDKSLEKVPLQKTPSAKSEQAQEQDVETKPVQKKKVKVKSVEDKPKAKNVTVKADKKEGKDVKKSPKKSKAVDGKTKKVYKRPISPDSSDDDVLYSLNPDYNEDSSSELLESLPSPSNLTDAIVAKMVAGDNMSSTFQGLSPRKLLLMDSMKPKTKIVKPVPRQTNPVSPAKAATATVQEGANYKTPPSSPLQSNRARIQTAAESQCPDSLYMSDLPTVPVMPIIPTSPSTASYKTLLSNLPHSLQPQRGGKRNGKGEESGEEGEAVERRVSVRNSESAFRYKEIIVKKCTGYTQMWLFTTSKTKNALNPKVLQELCQALQNAKFDDSRLVLLSGSGSIFCSGIDLNYLLSGDRRQSAQAMADALRDFVNLVIAFPKPIVAAVNGPAIGLGAAILPLCDIIYASDKASFFCPYGRLGQTPEACSSFTFPQVMGMAMANDILLGGRKLTAIEAYQIGLVSQVFWPTSMMQEVIPRVQNISSQSIRSLEGSKLLIRSHQRGKMELTNESECRMLVDRWSSGECQRAMRTYLDEELDYMM